MAPEWRSPPEGQRACLFLDEIQLIPGWEGFVRRVIDTEPIDLVITGSSTQKLSAEIASSMRGQGLDERFRAHLLSGYVDGTVLRDVIERHNVSQPVALRSLVHQLLGQSGGRFSPGLIGLFDRRGQRQLGQRLETVVALELQRRGCDLGYGLSDDRLEVDFVARHIDGTVLLVQVCVDCGW